MDPRERYNDPVALFNLAFAAKQARVWTAMPAIIQSVDFDKMTCVVQPAIQGIIKKPDGSAQFVNLPQCVDCPLVFPSGGGAILTFPVAQGDEVLLQIASRCIDAWWYNGGVQPPLDIRMHDLSDGFALAGVKSVPSVPASISPTLVELRNDANDTKISLDPNGKVIDVKAPNGLTIEANVTITGEVKASGDVIAGNGGNNISVLNHVHNNNDPDGAVNTSAPIAGT